MRFAGKVVQQRSRQSRFADARFTGDHHHLALTCLCFRPPPHQQIEFFLARDKLCKAARVQGLEAALNRRWAQRGPRSQRARYALKGLRAEVVKLEQIAHELAGTLRNHNAVRLRHTLQARRKVWRLTDYGLLLRSARPDEVADNHQSRCDADSRLQGRTDPQSPYANYQLQPRPDGPFRIVFVRLRIPEIYQYPIAHILRNEAAEPLHDVGDALLIGGNDLA